MHCRDERGQTPWAMVSLFLKQEAVVSMESPLAGPSLRRGVVETLFCSVSSAVLQ